MVLKHKRPLFWGILLFENDVNKYGTQASSSLHHNKIMFENDVNKYGTQAQALRCVLGVRLRMM